MVEVDTLDAVGQALDRVNKDGFQLSSTLGRHTNDKMVSFYVRAPGDWDIEFGTDGMRVDETYYTAEEITADSYWGHEWVSATCRRRCGHDPRRRRHPRPRVVDQRVG